MFRLEPPTRTPPPSTGVEDPAPARAGRPVDVGRLVVAVRRAKWMIAGVAVVGGVAGVAAAKLAAPVTYTSQATLVWEPDEVEMADRTRAMKTLIDLVKVPSILARVRQRLDLALTVEQVGRRIEVASNTQSNVLILAATDDEADVAQRIAEATVESLLEHRGEVARARALDAGARLEGDLARARDASLLARQELLAFRRDNDLFDAPLQTETTIREAARLRGEADTARAEAEAELSRTQHLRSVAKGQSRQDTLSERVLMPGAVRLADAELERTSLEAQLTPQHPRVEALRAAEASLADRHRADPSGTTSERTIGRNPLWDSVQDGLVKSEAAEQAQRTREIEYRRLAEAARNELLQLGETEGRASALVAAVTVADKRLQDLETTRATLRDASLSPATGLRLLVPADRPARPSKSLRRPMAVASPLLAGFLAVFVVLARALWRLAAHAPTEVAYWSSLPVVASSTWPRQRVQLKELVADVLAAWSPSEGDTLVVPLAQVDAPDAERIHGRLGRAIARRFGTDAGRLLAASAPLSPATPGVRRELRSAARVLVVVRAGAHSALELAALRDVAPRGARIAVVVTGVADDVAHRADQVGDAREFWLDACSDDGTRGLARADGGTP